MGERVKYRGGEGGGMGRRGRGRGNGGGGGKDKVRSTYAKHTSYSIVVFIVSPFLS